MSIFWTPDDSNKIEKIEMRWPAETYFIPAGTPMSETGIANDDSAIGVLAENAYLEYEYDYGKNPFEKVNFTFIVVTSGFINIKEAEESFGEEYSDDCKTALENIVFVNPDNPSSFGGGSTPNPEELDSGSALIAVDGEWVPQHGYGYEHYEYDLLADDTVNTSDVSGENVGQFENPIQIEGYKTYLVVLNDNEYIRESYFSSDVESNLIGSLDFSEEPFAIYNDEYGNTVLMTESPGSYNVIVEEAVTVVEKIDEKFTGTKWNLIQAVELSEEVNQILVDLKTPGYKEYRIEIDTPAPGESSGSTLYANGWMFSNDGLNVYNVAVNSGFWDFYPGDKNERMCVDLMQSPITEYYENTELVALRVQASEGNNIAVGKPLTAKDSGWVKNPNQDVTNSEIDDSGHTPFRGWHSLRYNRKCVAGTKYFVWGR